MGSIKFTKVNGRLKRRLPGEDHYSGLLFYTAYVIPAAFTNGAVEVNDLDHAEELGITVAALAAVHYHISECFRLNPDVKLWVMLVATPAGAHTFSEVGDLRRAANNKLRQVGVFTTKAFLLGQIALLQDMYTEGFGYFSPFEILFNPNMDGVVTANLPDLSDLTSPNVHVLIAQDGGAAGKDLYTTAGFSIGCVGAAIGATSLAKVHENIGWVEKFNLAQDGGELDIPALSNGDLVSSLADALTKDEGTFDDKRLMFLKKYPGITGTYFNDTHGACPADSDYAYMEDNRPIDKAIRGIYVKMMPFVNGPTLLEHGTGKLRLQTVDVLELEAGKALEQMEKDGELSGYSVNIDADQDVNANGKIEINISNTKVGVSRRFAINIGY